MQNRKPCRIRDRSPWRSLAQTVSEFLTFCQWLRRDFDETLGRDLAVRELVHRNAISSAGRLLAGRIGNRSHRRVEVFAVTRESQPDEVALPGRPRGGARAIVRKTAQPIIGEVENRDRLAHAALLRAIS